MKEPHNRLDTRTVLARAVEQLIAHYGCSSDEAWARVQQEAMAKRVPLDQVARAIVTGVTLSYRPNAPILAEIVL